MDPVTVVGAIALIGGAMTGITDYFFGKKKKNDALEAEKKRLKAQLARNLELMDAEWELDVKQANKTANRADSENTLSEAVTGHETNAALASLGMQQEQAALGYNTAAIGSGTQTGASLDAIAQGGTRGSSALQGVAMSEDLERDRLQAQEDADRFGGEFTLQSAVNSMMLSAQNMQERRTDAREMRESYAVGGDAYNMYQKQRANYEADARAQIDALSEQQDYWDLSDWKSPMTIFEHGTELLSSAFHGANSGYQLGSGIANYASKWSKNNTTQDIAQSNTTSIFNKSNNGYYNAYTQSYVAG